MTKRSSHRNRTPFEFIAHIQNWRRLKDYKDTHTLQEWKALLASEGVPSSTANKRLKMAYCLLPDPEMDAEYLRAIAYLHIPHDVLMSACSDNVTKEQRDRFFSLFSEDEMVLQEEAEKRLEQVLHPPKPSYPSIEKPLLTIFLDLIHTLEEQLKDLLA